MKPLITYYGGSARNASKIIQLIDSVPHTIYAEPFCGGAAVLFAKPIKYSINQDSYIEVVNDSNHLICNLYKVAIDQPEELNRRLQLTPYSRQVYEESVKVCCEPTNYPGIEVAVATVVQCRQSFGNGMYKGWAFSRYCRNQAKVWANFQDDLVNILARLRGVHVENDDAVSFIQRWSSPQTVFYCDPPYVGTCQGHYSDYNEEEYQALIDCLDNCNGSYILENYAQNIEPSSAQYKVETETLVSINSRKQEYKKILWYVCDRSASARGELTGLLLHNQLQLF